MITVREMADTNTPHIGMNEHVDEAARRICRMIDVVSNYALTGVRVVDKMNEDKLTGYYEALSVLYTGYDDAHYGYALYRALGGRS